MFFYNIVYYLQAVDELLSTDASVHWHFTERFGGSSACISVA